MTAEGAYFLDLTKTGTLHPISCRRLVNPLEFLFLDALFMCQSRFYGNRISNGRFRAALDKGANLAIFR